jgi:hypothetical protein
LFWFQTGDGTRKAKNVARDKRCTGSLSTNEFDLAVNGSAEKVSNAADVARVSAVWVAGGWTCEVDASGIGLTAPFNAPAVGPAPWFVDRITPRSATSVSTIGRRHALDVLTDYKAILGRPRAQPPIDRLGMSKASTIIPSISR